jgi:hypothetical protein
MSWPHFHAQYNSIARAITSSSGSSCELAVTSIASEQISIQRSSRIPSTPFWPSHLYPHSLTNSLLCNIPNPLKGCLQALPYILQNRISMTFGIQILSILRSTNHHIHLSRKDRNFVSSVLCFCFILFFSRPINLFPTPWVNPKGLFLQITYVYSSLLAVETAEDSPSAWRILMYLTQNVSVLCMMLIFRPQGDRNVRSTCKRNAHFINMLLYILWLPWAWPRR